MQKNSYDQYYQMQMYYNLRNSNRSAIKNYGLWCGFSVLLYILLSNVVTIILYHTDDLYNLYKTNDVTESAFDIIISLISLFLPFLILAIVKKKEQIIEKINFTKPESKTVFFLLILIGFAACMLSNFVSSWLSMLLSYLGFVPQSSGADVSTNVTLMGFIFVALRTAVMPALIEEFAVRGVIMQPLRKYGDKFAIITSALVFAFMHGNVVQGFFAFLVGLVLGYLVIATGTIWTGVAVHFLNNMLSVCVSTIGVKNVAAANIFYWVTAVAVIILGILSFVYYLVKKKSYRLKKPRTCLSDGEMISSFITAPSMLIAIIILAITAISGMI